jgi:hypothetical protein
MGMFGVLIIPSTGLPLPLWLSNAPGKLFLGRYSSNVVLRRVSIMMTKTPAASRASLRGENQYSIACVQVEKHQMNASASLYTVLGVTGT